VRTPSSAKAKARIGWEPRVPFLEGVRDVVAALEKEGK
jgi:nucleoside-diphosphate-sugar epimerase